MVNPFTQTEVDILKEAFPTIQVSVIDDTLRTTRGDVNQAFEMLLNITDPSQPPPLPNRPNNSFSNPSLNPFTSNAKPFLTVRQELAQWRQELRTESRQRAEYLRNNACSTPSLSFSSMFTSSSNQHNNERYTNNYRVPSIPSIPSVPSVPHFQRPMISVPNNSSPHISYTNSSNYSTHGCNNSNPIVEFPPTRHRPSCVPPALPVRRQSNNSINSNYNTRTNPCLGSSNGVPPMRRPNPIMPTHQAENQTESFNPFEEPELPPPAYSEIQKDTLINLAP